MKMKMKMKMKKGVEFSVVVSVVLDLVGLKLAYFGEEVLILILIIIFVLIFVANRGLRLGVLGIVPENLKE